MGVDRVAWVREITEVDDMSSDYELISKARMIIPSTLTTLYCSDIVKNLDVLSDSLLPFLL